MHDKIKIVPRFMMSSFESVKVAIDRVSESLTRWYTTERKAQRLATLPTVVLSSIGSRNAGQRLSKKARIAKEQAEDIPAC